MGFLLNHKEIDFLTDFSNLLVSCSPNTFYHICRLTRTVKSLVSGQFQYMHIC